MEARESAIAKQSAPRRSQQQPIVSESALGMVSTRSFPAIVGTADMMLKSSSVRLVGYEKIGSGYCTAVVRGRIADVRIAVEEGAAVAEQFGQFISKSVISRPLANLEAVLPISGRLAKFVSERGYSRLSDLAIGMGFSIQQLATGRVSSKSSRGRGITMTAWSSPIRSASCIPA